MKPRAAGTNRPKVSVDRPSRWSYVAVSSAIAGRRVAEDATYWSAIASERATDSAGAVRRYRDLLDRFPTTTRAAEARAAITRLAP